jgi:hypothetical protein
MIRRSAPGESRPRRPLPIISETPWRRVLIANLDERRWAKTFLKLEATAIIG